MENKKLIIGTRGSKLALWQAKYTQTQLKNTGVESELKIIKTKGDKIQHLGFDKIEGKGFFTKELEEELLNGTVDLAVHSMKDLPTESPEGLVLTAVSYRENPADWLLIRPESFSLTKPLRLKKNAIVGTSSARRKAQMKDIRDDITLKDIRGNVPTRIEKLRKGKFDAILLAAAGIQRLALEIRDLETVHLHPKEFVPAPAQGVLAFQTRMDDLETRRVLKKLHNPEVAEVTNIERKVLKLLNGGCHMPLGVYCLKDSSANYHVWAAKADTWDSPVKRVRLSSSTSFELAESVVEKLLEA